MARFSYDTAYLPQAYRYNGNHVAGVIDYLSLMMSVVRERRQLRQLGPEALKDMGLDKADVARELARPFWDLPKRRLD